MKIISIIFSTTLLLLLNISCDILGLEDDHPKDGIWKGTTYLENNVQKGIIEFRVSDSGKKINSFRFWSGFTSSGEELPYVEVTYSPAKRISDKEFHVYGLYHGLSSVECDIEGKFTSSTNANGSFTSSRKTLKGTWYARFNY